MTSLLMNKLKAALLFFTFLVSQITMHVNFVAIMYCFYGISLVTQNYINPSIDIIKAKGIVSFIFK